MVSSTVNPAGMMTTQTSEGTTPLSQISGLKKSPDATAMNSVKTGGGGIGTRTIEKSMFFLLGGSLIAD